ncbi:two transmembrane segments containing protein [Variovorax phage VarioGold]|uniref:hypothetical protein n=1 Tax=Variovorax sp. ZS18.2.2 TaxID=2971255 RepID=UPI002150F215|nr:hypothetical protein [Variovorax sp. ZS18.2.2]MCR6477511.1 hypothetical protein [Variovorax sp. ZS18.2.2]UYD72075.1 two transmembrane segments containing protein [Variovorax phage VarioGold]
MTLREFWRVAIIPIGVFWVLMLALHFIDDQPRLALWEVLVRLVVGSILYFAGCKLLAWIASEILEE